MEMNDRNRIVLNRSLSIQIWWYVVANLEQGEEQVERLVERGIINDKKN